MTASTKIGTVMADFLWGAYSGPVAIHDPRAVLTIDCPVCAVFVEESRPIAPYEPVFDCIVRLAVMHDAEVTSPADAADESSAVFDVFDESAFTAFANGEGVEISTAHLDTETLAIEEMRWVHAQRIRVIGALAL